MPYIHVTFQNYTCMILTRFCVPEPKKSNNDDQRLGRTGEHAAAV